eukprot:1373228-Rhodomonas_salina.2
MEHAPVLPKEFLRSSQTLVTLFRQDPRPHPRPPPLGSTGWLLLRSRASHAVSLLRLRFGFSFCR